MGRQRKVKKREENVFVVHLVECEQVNYEGLKYLFWMEFEQISWRKTKTKEFRHG